MQDMRTTVVVGVDGSAGADAALQRAVAEARERGLSLTLVHAWQLFPGYEGELAVALQDVDDAEAAVLQAAADRLEELAPDLEHDTRLLHTSPQVALVDAARTAALLVLGRHAGSSAWLGSVLGHVAAHAACPVLVVPPDAHPERGDVVLGVDGTALSVDAVEHAFGQADRWGTDLVAVLAVTPGFDAYVPSLPVLEQVEERGRRHLAEALAGGSERWPDVRVRQLVALGSPLPALRAAAQDAGVLVVGSHGRGALGRFALGSVSSSLLRSSPCPVAVVRATVVARAPAPRDPAASEQAAPVGPLF